jgi:hypothetical protein
MFDRNKKLKIIPLPFKTSFSKHNDEQQLKQMTVCNISSSIEVTDVAHTISYAVK